MWTRANGGAVNNMDAEAVLERMRPFSYFGSWWSVSTFRVAGFNKPNSIRSCRRFNIPS